MPEEKASFGKRKLIQLAFGVIGAIVGAAIVLKNKPPNATAMTGTLIGSVLASGFMGLLLGSIIVLFIPRPKIKCPECGSSNATAAHKSIVSGAKRPNKCPDCKKEW